MWGRGGDGLLRLQGRIAGLFGFAYELGGLRKKIQELLLGQKWEALDVTELQVGHLGLKPGLVG